MEIDLELYRKDVRVSVQPLVRLSVIDIAPDYPEHTMLFLHGFGGQARQWKYQLQAFSASNRVIAIDLRGHGRSDQPRGLYSMDVIQADLDGVLDTLGINEKIILAGHSFGGAVATEFAVSRPQRIKQLILIATAGKYQLNRLYRLLLRLPGISIRSLAPFTRGWLSAPPTVLKDWYEDNLSQWNGWSKFQEVKAPTLVIRGHRDRVFQKPQFEEVARSIPDSEEVDVGASAHMVMLERREAVNRAITRFISAGDNSWSGVAASFANPQHTQLFNERPWLPNYDPGTPYTIAIPRVTLHSLLYSAARRFSGRTALIFEGKRIPYRRLNQEANRFANLLGALGVKKGDRVMIILPNMPQLVIAFFGTLIAGGVAVFALPTTKPEELIRQISDAGAQILVTLTQFDTLIHEIKTTLEPSGESPLKHVIYTHVGDYLPLLKRLFFNLSRERRQRHLLDIPLDTSTHVLRKVLYSYSKNSPEIELSPDELAAILFTGGTTDRPKGVMLSHRNLVSNALQTRHWMPEVQEGRERFLCVMPFSHSYGLTTGLVLPIALGATLILRPSFKVEETLKFIQRYRPTIFPGVPQMYVAIIDFPGVRKYGIDSIKACICGSAPLAVEVQEAFEKLTHGRLVEGYGLTEASPVTHANPLNGERKVGTIGIPLPSTEARVVDLRKGKKSVAIGQIGELAVRGPQVMLGYWNDPQETSRVLSAEGWLLTGDVAQMDSEGYFRIIARKADMWYPERPDRPAFPRDIEEALFEVPQVKEAAVIAIAGQPIAFVIARKERPSADALIAYCKRRLPPELVPRIVIFVDDFPRSFIGKVLRRELAKRYEESRKTVESETESL